MTEIVQIDAEHPDPAAITRAAGVLLAGGLVAFPTETVYGLGGLADDASSIARIYEAKGRPATNPLIAHVVGEPEARAIAARWPPAAETLARAFWPGPLTLVVPRGKSIPRSLSAGLDAMAIRAPSHPVAIALMRAVGRPIAAPSANPSMQLSPTRAEHVMKGLGGRIELVLDAGPCALGIESTVVDVTREPPRILRPGSLSLEDLERAVPGITFTKRRSRTSGARRSPGMDRKHYAPRAQLVVTVRAQVAAMAAHVAAPVGIISRIEPIALHGAAERTLPGDAAHYGAALFDALHALDDAGCNTIVLEAVPEDPSWMAIRDRIDRASAT